MNSNKLFNSPKFLIYISVSTILLFIVSLFYRQFNIDEGVIAGHSFYLNKLGFVKSELYACYGYGWEYRQYHYHKLFVLLGAIIIDFLGFSLTILRLIPLAASLGTTILVYKYIKSLKEINSIIIFPLFVIFYIVHCHIFCFSFWFRPEVVVMFFGFASFYLFNKWRYI